MVDFFMNLISSAYAFTEYSQFADSFDEEYKKLYMIPHPYEEEDMVEEDDEMNEE